MNKSKIQVRYIGFGKKWDSTLSDDLKEIFLKDCGIYPLTPFKSEVLRIALFHPDFEKADLSDIKEIIGLKFRLSNNGKELNKEFISVEICSFPCYIRRPCCKYPRLINNGQYNQTDEIKLLPFRIPLGDYRYNNWENIYISRLLIDPTIFISIEYPNINKIDDWHIDIIDKNNFELIKATNPFELCAGSKILPSDKKFIKDKKLQFLTKNKNIGRKIDLSNYCEKDIFEESDYSDNNKEPTILAGHLKFTEKEFEEMLKNPTNELFKKLKLLEKELEKY